MKTFSSRARFVACQSTQMGMVCLALMLGAIVLSAGCGKKSAPPVSNTSPAQTNQEAVSSQPAPAAPGSAENSQPAVVANPANNAADLKQLNRALVQWIIRNHQSPKNFEDFVARAQIQVAPPPAGKKYIIDKRGFVALVDTSTP